MQSIRHPLQSFVFLLLMVFAVHASAVPTGPVIGNVSLVLGTVQGVDQDGDVFEVSRGADLYAGYTLTTGSRGMVRATMNDGTTLTLGRDSDATLDSFEFDSTSGAGGFDATVRRGGFEYESGDLGKFALNRQHSSISTPAGVIGVRGTKIEATINQDGTIVLKVPKGNVDFTTVSGITYKVDPDTGVVSIDTSSMQGATPEQEAAIKDFTNELETQLTEAVQAEGTPGDYETRLQGEVESDESGGVGDLEVDDDGNLTPVSPTGSPTSS